MWPYCFEINPVAKAKICCSFHGQVQIFPNPIQNGESNLHLPQIENMEAFVWLYDGLGRLALSQKLNEGRNTLSVDLLSNGIYHMEVQLNQQIVRKRIVINQ